MDKLRNYDIAFSGLKDGKHTFSFEINEAFFNLFETEQEFSNPRITADVLLNKHTTFLEFEINAEGSIQLVCDITLKDFDFPIENQIKVLDGQKKMLYDSGFVVNKNRGLLNIAHQDYYINEQFYGKAFGSGIVKITGKGANVLIDGVARTEKGTDMNIYLEKVN